MDAREPLTREQVQQRPTLEDEEARVLAVRDAVRDALASELGLDDWREFGDASGAGCGNLRADGLGDNRQPAALLLTGGVPDRQWTEAVEIVTRVAGRSGFGQPIQVVDRPGQHEVELRGERESVLRLGTVRNATLTVETGCHLPAARHPTA